MLTSGSHLSYRESTLKARTPSIFTNPSIKGRICSSNTKDHLLFLQEGKRLVLTTVNSLGTCFMGCHFPRKAPDITGLLLMRSTTLYSYTALRQTPCAGSDAISWLRCTRALLLENVSIYKQAAISYSPGLSPPISCPTHTVEIQ